MHKPLLIILPGWGGNRLTWNEFICKAEKKFDVECIELPCFGIERCPDSIWRVEQYAEFVKKKIEEIKLATTDRPIILLGHSFGGQVAVYIASHNSQLINKLILSGAAVFRDDKSIRRGLFYAIAKIGKLLFKLPFLEKLTIDAQRILYRIAKSPDYSHTTGIKREIFKKIVRQDMSHFLSKIDLPTLVIWGTKDSHVPLRYGKQIAELIPGAKLKIIKRGKHGLHMQYPNELLSLILDFV